MKKAIVFLRSFGDFTIAISVLRKSASLQDHVFYASVHLEPLYKDLKAALPDIQLNIQFIDFGIRKKIFGYFTNKHSVELHSFMELMKLKKWLSGMKDEELFFEQRRKQWVIAPFLGRTYPYIHQKSKNIYDSYLAHFGVAPESLAFSTPHTNAIHKILVLPESRKKSKSFQPIFIHELASSLTKQGFDVTTAFFKKIQPVPVGKLSTHDSFADLIGLIQSADLVITADSLPAHLSQLLHREHFVFYEGKPNPEWMTPYARERKAFGVVGDVAHVIDFIDPVANT
jgi:ADP-heptose:LPS heptosyltransferase